MKIIIGLGNPGLRYRNTRHNAGFMVLKALAKKHRLSIRKHGFQGKYGMGNIGGEQVVLFEPLTFMNLSGNAVEAICSSKLENKDDLIIISDDFNLPLGQLRMRDKGSAGGHNGLQSIIDRMGSDFTRLRLGVGSGNNIGDMSGYVLSPFPRSERALLNEMLEKSVECIEVWLAEGTKEVMSRYN